MATDLYATHANDGTIYPNTSAINSSGPSATDGTELIAVGFNNYQSGRQQALLNYAGLTPTGVVESNTVSQELEAFRKGFAVGPGMYVQRAIYDDPSTNGDRVIMLAEQGVLIASYPELTAKVYVTDANNAAVAAAGGKYYKSTDAAGTTPSTSGTYLQLPAQPEPGFLKQYLGVTAGAASDEFVISSSPAILSLSRAVAIPYQTIDGIYRLIFNCAYTVALSSRIGATASISGVSFKTGPDQAVATKSDTTSTRTMGIALSNTGNVQIVHGPESTQQYIFSGDVELNSKPTWADDFEIPWGITY